MTGWIITFVILFLLAIAPLGAEVRYDANGPLVKIIAGFLRIQLIPAKKLKKPKKEKTQKEKKPEKKKEKPKKEDKPKEKKSLGGTIEKFWPFVKLGVDFLGDFKRKIRVNVLELNLTMAGDDPCDLAVNYGRAWAAIANLDPMLERAFVIKKRDIHIGCDFESDKTVIYARLDITITLGRIVGLLVRYGIRAVKLLLKTKKLSKKVESV